LICLLAGLFWLQPVARAQLFQSAPNAPNTAVRKVTKRGPRDTPETILGERLFMETRFSQYFAAHCNGDVNRPLAQGDPVVAHVRNPRAGVLYPSPVAGKSMNCRTCHFVDEFTQMIAGENRTYADYVPRSPVPYRSDGRTVTVRNARNMVDDYTPRRGEILLHGDGEFLTVESLAQSVLTGRVFGWLLADHDEAVRHIVKVIREDDGRDELGQQYGGSYAKLMLGTAPDLPEQSRLESAYRIDVSSATDQQIFDEVARLLGAYLKSLQLEQSPAGIHTGSAYDMFLAKNNLPLMPATGESDTEYSQRLLQAVEQLQNPKFVLPYERYMRFHPHNMVFGAQELAGLKIFLRQGSPGAPELSAQRDTPLRDLPLRYSPFLWLAGLPLFGVVLGRASRRRRLGAGWTTAAAMGILLCVTMTAAMSANQSANQSHSATQSANQSDNPGAKQKLSSTGGTAAAEETGMHAGNCAHCHSAPDFTDVSFHNNGAAQEEYDAVHGAGSFMQLAVPGWTERNRNPDRYVVATPAHPHGSCVFRAIPAMSNPMATDLGMWNIYANPDFPEVQSRMQRMLCGTGPCDPEEQLPRTIGRFRTAGLRDLGHSWPYLHTGRMEKLEDVLHFYVRMAALERSGQLRNGDPELGRIRLDEQDVAALVAFLRALDEDYDN